MPEIVEIKGIGPVLAKDCVANGYGSVEKIATAKVAEFIVVPGVSEVRAEQLIGAARTLLNGGVRIRPLQRRPARAISRWKSTAKKNKKKKNNKKKNKDKKKNKKEIRK